MDGGDSRDEGRGTNGQTYSHGSLKAVMFKGGVWAELADAGGAGSNTGTIWPRVATQFMASQNVPFAIIRRGTGGTDVAGVNNSWVKNNSDYANLVSAVTASTVTSVKAALFLLGPNAIYNANNAAIPLATYATALGTLASNLAADLPGAPKLFVDICGEMASALPPDPRTARDNIRGGVLYSWNNNSAAIKGGPVLIEQDYSDDVHLKTDAQINQGGDRYFLPVEAAFYGGSNGRGPLPSSIGWDIARTHLTLIFNRPLKTGLTHAVQAWIINDVGGVGVMTISGIAYHGSNPNALVFTVSTAATGAAGSTRLSLGSGDDAVGRVIPLSTDITMPAGGTINIPAEPIYAYAVTEFDNTPPSLSSLNVTANSSTTASGSVSTNDPTGTLYKLASVNPTELTATVKAAQSQAVTATGAQSLSFTGLTPSTVYYPHAVHTDPAGNDSTVLDGASFTTPAAPAPAPPSSGALARVGITADGKLIVLFP